MEPMAVRLRMARCRPCTLVAARYDVAKIRAWLIEQGIEPGF
jgi:hypothetical protein